MTQLQVTLPDGVSAEAFQKALASLAKKPTVKEIGADVVFSEWESTNQLIRVHKGSYRGKELLWIQKFWRSESQPDWQPGKGVTFTYEDIEPIIEGLQKMKEWCEEHPRGEDKIEDN